MDQDRILRSERHDDGPYSGFVFFEIFRISIFELDDIVRDNLGVQLRILCKFFWWGEIR